MLILKNAPFFRQLILGWAMASSNDNGKFLSTQGNARLAPDFLAQHGCHGIPNFNGINPGIWGSKLWDPRCNYNGVVLLKKIANGSWDVGLEMFDEPWTHDSTTSILSIFQPKFYFTPTLLTHLWWSDFTVPRNAQDFSLSACGTPPQTPMSSCWSLICAPVGCLDGNSPLVWTCVNLCKPWAMDSRSAPLTSYIILPCQTTQPPLGNCWAAGVLPTLWHRRLVGHSFLFLWSPRCSPSGHRNATPPR